MFGILFKSISIVFILDGLNAQVVIKNEAEIVWNALTNQGPGQDTCNKPKLTGTDLFGCSNSEKLVVCHCGKCGSVTGAQVLLVCKNSKWYPYSQGSNVLCIDKFENDEIICTYNDCRCKTNCKQFQLTCDNYSIRSKININCKKDYEQTSFNNGLSAKFYVNGTVEFFCNNGYQLEGEKYQNCTDARRKRPKCIPKTYTTTRQKSFEPTLSYAITQDKHQSNRESTTSGTESIISDNEKTNEFSCGNELYILLICIMIILSLLLLTFCGNFLLLIRDEKLRNLKK